MSMTQDPVEVDWTALADARRLREAGLFVAEGRRIVARVLRAGPDAFEVVRVLATPPAVAALRLDETAAGRLDVLTASAMATLTGFNFHRGVLALVRRPATVSITAFVESLDAARTLVVGEHLTDVDNVGSVFRNARAFGASGVLLDDTSADPLYRKAVRTSMGAVLDLPWTCAPPETVSEVLRASGFCVVALTPAPDALPLSEALAVAHSPLALLIGNEGDGLSAAALERSDLRARIPMAPGADSLNVATALAVALYECATRRR